MKKLYLCCCFLSSSFLISLQNGRGLLPPPRRRAVAPPPIITNAEDLSTDDLQSIKKVIELCIQAVGTLRYAEKGILRFLCLLLRSRE